MTSPERPTLYTDADVMAYLHVSIHQLRRWRACGKLRFIRVGRDCRYTDEHLTEFIGQCESHNNSLEKGP